MIIRSKTLAVTTLAVFVVGIILSMAFNWWQTEGSRTPAKYRSGRFEGAYNPADIRGSYTLADVSRSFDVSVEVLANAFGVTGSDMPEAFRISTLEGLYGHLPDGGEVGTDAVRLFVARYTGLPYTPEESTRLPSLSLSYLKDRVDEDTMTELRSISVTLNVLRAAAGESSEDHEAVGTESHDEGDTTIKGKTTFNELLNWGLTKEEIETILDMPMGARSMTVRDFIFSKDLEFGTYKAKFQELIDSKQ